jgi:hypothetical protein
MVLAGFAVLLPLAAWAADVRPLDAKVGLWETSASTEVSGMPAMPQIPEATLAKMPPEQRARLEAMMKSRSGGGGPQMTTKVCLTRESLQAGALGRNDKSCTSNVVSSSASKQLIHVECNQGEAKSTGDLTVELVDPQHMKGTMLMKSSVGGQSRDMKMSFDTKWIAADCGAVKPFTAK